MGLLGLAELRSYLLALVVGAVFGIFISNQLHKAALFESTQQSKKLSSTSVAKSNTIEVETAAEKQKTEVRYRTITKEIIKYVPETIIKECKTHDGVTVATTLSNGAVSLLNSADDANLQSADIPQSQAATEVGLRELSDYIIAIKKDYTDLSIEHDALIDYNDFYKNLTK